MTPAFCSDRLCEERPITVDNWDDPSFPVLITIPHAGRLYPTGLADSLALPPEQLLSLEDRLVDCLAERAIARGFAVIRANAPRLWIDCNRDPSEVDRQMAPDRPGSDGPPSTKLRAGLGLVPSRLGRHGPIWRHPLGWVEVARRLSHLHQPYHAKIARRIGMMRHKFGAVVLVDLHSMPPLTDVVGQRRADLVIGTLHGESCAPSYAAIVAEQARAGSLLALRDAPYAGGYTVASHGAPLRGVHAVQLEIDRSLYLDQTFFSLGPGAGRLIAWLEALVLRQADHALDEMSLAAE